MDYRSTTRPATCRDLHHATTPPATRPPIRRTEGCNCSSPWSLHLATTRSTTHPRLEAPSSPCGPRQDRRNATSLFSTTSLAGAVHFGDRRRSPPHHHTPLLANPAPKSTAPAAQTRPILSEPPRLDREGTGSGVSMTPHPLQCSATTQPHTRALALVLSVTGGPPASPVQLPQLRMFECSLPRHRTLTNRVFHLFSTSFAPRRCCRSGNSAPISVRSGLERGLLSERLRPGLPGLKKRGHGLRGPHGPSTTPPLHHHTSTHWSPMPSWFPRPAGPPAGPSCQVLFPMFECILSRGCAANNRVFHVLSTSFAPRSQHCFAHLGRPSI
jgi:hypothetical protein